MSDLKYMVCVWQNDNFGEYETNLTFEEKKNICAVLDKFKIKYKVYIDLESC